MNHFKKIFIGTSILLAAISIIAYFAYDDEKIADAGVEAFQLGAELVVLGGTGSTTVGDYPDPIPEGPDVKEIVLAYTCIGTEVLFNNILPSFAQYWYDLKGEKVRFTTGWNSIGRDSVATYVYDKPVEVLILSSMNNAQTRGYSETKWQKTKNKGIVYSYPWVFVVRKDNPLNINTYEDLLRPEVRVAHIDPLGTHGGMWTVFSLYGNALKKSEKEKGIRDDSAAEEYLRQVEEKAITGPTGGGSAALFAQGKADVLITIEPMAMRAAKFNPDFEIIYPPNTIVTDLAVYTLKKSIPKEDKELINAFVDFLFTQESQDAYAKGGYRPSDDAVVSKHPKFKALESPINMEYLGEPTKVKKELFLDKWVKARNSSKPEHEKLKLKQLPHDQIPDKFKPVEEM